MSKSVDSFSYPSGMTAPEERSQIAAAFAETRKAILENKALGDAMKFAAARSAPFIPNAGNLGDALLNLGTFDFFSEIGWNPDVLSANYAPEDLVGRSIIVLGGGGGWKEGLWEQHARHLRPFLESGGELIVLPSTIDGFREYFSRYYEQITLFIRERTSAERLAESPELSGRVFLCPDMAFAVSQERFERFAARKGSGQLAIFRSDEESANRKKPRTSIDIPILWNGFDWRNAACCVALPTTRTDNAEGGVASAQSNLVTASTKARGYFELCKAVAGEHYTDVVLLPFLTKGGAEKYILSVLDGLRELEPDSRFLFLGGQHFEKHEWLDRLPEGSLFVDLHRLGVVDLDQKDIEHISFRLIQNLPGVRRLHVKSCEYAESLLQEYSSYLRDIPTFLYYFCEASYVHDGIRFVNGHNFNLISEVGTNFTGIISDHAGALDYIGEVIGDDVPSKTHALYVRCDLDRRERQWPSGPLNRVIWASRIDSQKRPDLLVRIARRLAEDLPGVSIEAFGSTTYGLIGPDVFDGVANLRYRGAFDGFGDIPVDRYDAFLYTAAFDGLPNVVLEALASGLPVIAPDVGGIREAVSSETGYLVEDGADDDALARRYVDALKSIHREWDEARRRALNGRALIAERHSKEAFLGRIAEIFGLDRKNA